MRFTSRQKEIIRKICSKEVWDIFTFVKNFQKEHIVHYDWNQIQQAFQNDTEAVTYYCPKKLSPTPANLIKENEFTDKVREGQIKSEDYKCFNPKLERSYAKRVEQIYGKNFSFDFYKNVRVADSLEDIVEFLAIWQFLRGHALVLEVPQPLTSETVGVFFERIEIQEQKQIPFQIGDTPDTLFFSDRRYITDEVYSLSSDYLEICREFLGKRLYPAPGLKVFVQNHFKTQDEIAQTRNLIAAWVAIIVAILIGLAPYMLQMNTKESDMIQYSEITRQIIDQTSNDVDCNN